MVEVNDKGEALCRYCSKVARFKCTGPYIFGLFVCDKHQCPECRPIKDDEPEPEETADEEQPTEPDDRGGPGAKPKTSRKAKADRPD